ncbi:hypothetical protein [Sorangium sp. So ce385]|uniref:hypothetical protein n=1 Tax=Sorangium sp. So ce385 TaxID=3133308 RepID=UPI003F5BAFF6
MTRPADTVDPVPHSAWPELKPVTSTKPPVMPAAWTATVLLHPFSPPQSNDPNPSTPFFELCVARLLYLEDTYFSAQITGCSSGKTWWYIITPNETLLLTGGTWAPVDMGWSLPSNWFGSEIANAVCSGSSPLNWMNAQTADWWRAPVPNADTPAATWVWFDSATGAPVRMMFGVGPRQGPNVGDPMQLAVLQMYSFSYFATFSAAPDADHPRTVAELKAHGWTSPSIDGFAIGNPNGYDNFAWNGNFGMTAFMTPVNKTYNPLPTRVLYVWKPDGEYSVYSDRAQSTMMCYDYNQGNVSAVQALLTGRVPYGVKPPRNSRTSLLIEYHRDGQAPSYTGPRGGFDFPQQPPDWVSTRNVQGTIHATITNNQVLCPKTVVTVFAVLFPPSPPHYPDSTYLWTWYAPQNESGTQSRPITFMQSQSGVNEGTSLALADYFYYQSFSEPIDPANFNFPDQSERLVVNTRAGEAKRVLCFVGHTFPEPPMTMSLTSSAAGASDAPSASM